MIRPLVRVLAVLSMSVAVGGIAAAPNRPRAQITTPQVFQSATDVTGVPVSVRSRNRPVAGLTASDFALTDGGVRQVVDSVAVGSGPIDLTVVLDASGSMAGAAFDQLQKDVEDLGTRLDPDDRLRVLVFSTMVQEVFPMARVGTPARQTSLAPAGGTSFYQAIAAALLVPTEPGRPHLVVVMSDGIDTVSWLDGGDILQLSRRSGAVLRVVIRSRTSGIVSRGPLDDLEQAAALTGGRLDRVSLKMTVSALFAQAIDEFRTSYVLWYKPTNAAQPGWHDLVVTVPSGKYDVVARRGYFVGAK